MKADAKATINAVRVALGYPVQYPGLKLKDLSPEFCERVGRYVIDGLRERDRRAPSAPDEVVYLAVLENFGLDCPHTRRVTHDYYPPGAWDCAICGCAFRPSASIRRVSKPSS
ncbi:MAG: hypothetical protein LLG45_08375 [Actinomycetia bacterium]|nr:hypothetical protein [Actinomycetes bacterium]